MTGNDWGVTARCSTVYGSVSGCLAARYDVAALVASMRKIDPHVRRRGGDSESGARRTCYTVTFLEHALFDIRSIDALRGLS